VSAENKTNYSATGVGKTDELRDALPRRRRLSDDQPSLEQIAIFRRMTPEQRWRAAHRLYWTCRRHKTAFLQSQHPDWSQQEVDDEVRRIFQHART
jgi:hypothetical protein